MVLISSTILLFGLFERYEVSGAQLLNDPDFELDSDDWESWRGQEAVRRSTGSISLDGSGGVAVARQSLPAPEAQGLRLITEQRLNTSERSDEGMARVLVLSYSDRARWDLPFGSLVARRDGTWRQSSVDVPLDPGVTGLTVFVQNLKVDGVHQVRHVALYPLQERSVFVLLSSMLQGMWLGFGGLCLVRFLRADGRMGGKLLVVGVALAIVGGTLMPKQGVRAVAKEVRAVGSEVTGSTPSQPAWYAQLELSQNNLHILFFALFVIVLCWWRPRIKLGELVTSVFLFAASTELLQFFAEYRQPGLGDFGRDLLGAGMGLVLSLVLLAWQSGRSRGLAENSGGPSG